MPNLTKNDATFDAHPLGLHRVMDGKKVLPQAAQRLDPDPPVRSNEILVAVEALQIDSASFAQLKKAHVTPGAIGDAIRAIVSERGKMQNPVTGSGGMLLGRVAEIGASYPDGSVEVGDRVATLISLTATPLRLEEIREVDVARERVLVKGTAILFARSIFAKMPDDVPEGAALAAFDICGAPLLVKKRVKAGDTVFILGLGKAGRSILAGLELQFGDQIKIFGTDASEAAVKFCRDTFPGTYAALDARDPVAVLEWVEKETGGALANFTVNTANVDGTEMSAILATRDGGRCFFFGMATSFQKAALGAESARKDVELLIGTGYTEGHANDMIQLLRNHGKLRHYFESHFA